MKYNQLQLEKQLKPTRVGRGISAGRGKTAGRGTKGQGSRKSGGVRPGFEGGQMPLYMRLPKLRGFKSKSPKAEVVYTHNLEKMKLNIDNFSLHEVGLVSSPYVKVKLISKGELTTKHTVSLQSASKSAISQIEKAGGSFNQVDRVARQPKSDKNT